jgi:hypothetical protein
MSAARHKVQVNDPAVAAQLAARGARLVADYGSFQVYETSQAGSPVSVQPGTEARDEYNFILLHAAKLDTSKPEVQALRKPVGAFQGKRMHLVQFAGPVKPAWRDELLATGVQIVTYLPHNAYVVYGDTASIVKVQALAANAPHIQWEGVYADDYKIHPDARLVDAQGQPRVIGTDLFAVQLVADTEANAATRQLLDKLKKQPFRKDHRVLNYHNFIVQLAPENLPLIAAQPDVVSIQPYFLPRKLDERQDQIIAGNLNGNLPASAGYLAWLASKGFTQAQFTNSGFAVDVSDSGLDNGTSLPNHPNLYIQGITSNASRVVYNRLEGTPNPGSTLKGCDGHGTLNSHVVGGYDDTVGFPHTDNANYHYGLGVCPFVKLGSSVIFDPDFFTLPNYTTLQSQAYNDGARVSNNSWGDQFPPDAGLYTIESQEYDSLVRDAQPVGSPYPTDGNQEMVIVFANGNSGPGVQTVTPPATGKNVFSVGAAENVQPFGMSDGCGIADSGADSANDIIFFSSRGPCADGRHKPDIMAPGTHITGGVAQAPNPSPTGTADPCFVASGVCGVLGSMFYPLGQELFTTSSGTSHSTPCVVGGCALLRQYFINNFGGPPSPAMTKSYLMNSARYMTGVYANDTLYSDNQGMGEMNLGTAFDGTPRILRDELATDLFTASGQSVSFNGTIATNGKPFRVTLAWTDAPGNTAGNAYNNDLDLTVTIGTNTYKGNVFQGANSVPGGTADSANNVESVFLPAGVSGTFTITITATDINSDGVPNNNYPLDQDFALVAYNAVFGIPPVINGIQPTNLMVLVTQPAAFSASVSGSTPFTFQWYKGPQPVPGATSGTFFTPSAQLADAGDYTLVVANRLGSATSAVATLTVVPTVPLPFALNTTSFSWSTDAGIPWYGQTNASHDGVASGRSYFIGDAQQTSLRTATNGPGALTFWWKVSSQANADILTFSDTAAGYSNALQISGEVDWNQNVVYLPAGQQSLQWTYSKDASISSGSDAGWVDQVSFAPGITQPRIVTQPVGQNTLAAMPVTFSVTAVGTPVLSYQWRLNGVDLPGATSTSLSLTNPGALDAGPYSVRVSSPYGSVTSVDAYLGVVPLAVSGDNTLGQIDVSLLATNAVGISAGAWHSLVLRDDGSILAWGENYDGQCNVPANLGNAIAVAAGGYHSLALNRNGTVTAWGANYAGQATPPAGLSNVVALAAGTWHSLALLANGTVVAWGDNTAGQSTVPAGLANVVAIAAGGSHSLALRADGTVVAWGENTDASGSFAGQSTVPFGLANVVAIGAGDYHSAAVKSDGTVVAWGDNSQGQTQTPLGLTNAVAVAGGGGHTVALRADATAAAWGNDWNGQSDFPPTLTNVIAVAAGNSHTLLLEGNRYAPPHLLRPQQLGKQFSVVLQTFAGKNYTLEYKTSLSAGAWTPLSTIRGNGSLQQLADANATGPQRFYHVRQW